MTRRLALAFGAFFVLAAGWHLLYGHSVDLGLHYALTNQLFTDLGVEGVTAQYLGVMAQYPSGAHWLAVVLSLVTHSPLISIVALTEISAYLGYVAIALFLIEGPLVLTLMRLAAMLAITRLLAAQKAAFGYQVIVNYFFPQLVGEALVLVALYLLSKDRFWTWRWTRQCAILFVATWMLTYIQPIAAMQLGGSLMIFVVVSAIIDNRGAIRRMLPGIGKPLAISAAILLAVVFHPAFRTMTAISANNGYLQFGGVVSIASYMGLVAFAGVASAMAFFGAITGRLASRRALILGSATLAAATLLLMQKAALAYGNLGSDYAVSKHVFFLAALAATTFVYAIAGLVVRAGNSAPAGRITLLGDALLPALFALCALYIVINNAEIWKQDLRRILDYQAYAQHYRTYALPIDGPGNIVSLNRSFTPSINFLVSFGDLKLPLPLAQASINSYKIFFDTPVKYAMVSSKLTDPGGLAKCAVGAPPSWQYAAVDRECFVKLQLVIEPNQPLVTASNQPGSAYLTEGWAAPETWGTWSITETAKIEFTIAGEPSDNKYLLHVRYIPFIAGERREQRFAVVADGSAGGKYSAADVAPKEFDVPIAGTGHHVIELKIDNPQSPKDLHLSAVDERRLGIGVMEMSLRGAP